MRRGTMGHARRRVPPVLIERLPEWPDLGGVFSDEDSDHRLYEFAVDDTDVRRALVAAQLGDDPGRWVEAWNEIEGWHEVFAVGDSRISETGLEQYYDALDRIEAFLSLLLPGRAAWLAIKVKSRRELDRRAAMPGGPRAPATQPPPAAPLLPNMLAAHALVNSPSAPPALAA